MKHPMVNPVSCYTARDSELQLHRASGCFHVWFLVPWQEGEGAQIFKRFNNRFRHTDVDRLSISSAYLSLPPWPSHSYPAFRNQVNVTPSRKPS